VSQKNDYPAITLAKMTSGFHGLPEKSEADEPVNMNKKNTLLPELAGNTIQSYAGNKLKPIIELPYMDKDLTPGTKALVSPPPVPKKNTGVPEQVAPSQKATIVADSPEDLKKTEMVVDVRYRNTILSPALMGYGNSKQIFLPLEDLARILDFNISTQVEKGTATGWFLSPDRSFDLDFNTQQGQIDGKPVTFSQQDVFTKISKTPAKKVRPPIMCRGRGILDS